MWLTRYTTAAYKVAIAEGSPVLLANAYHHRSDGFSSVVALLAIIGSHLGYPILDPLGGLFVSALIMKQGISLAIEASGQLSDLGIPDEEIDEIREILTNVKEDGGSVSANMIGFRNVRGVKSGAYT